VLLDDFEVRSGAWHFDFIGHRRLRHRIRIVREDHALAGLASVDSQDRFHRHPDVEWHAREPCPKADRIIGQFQIMCSGFRDIEDDFAVFDVLMRNADTIDGRIHDDVRRMAIVTHPLVHSANQVRPF
jgi:hypothetical protein